MGCCSSQHALRQFQPQNIDFAPDTQYEVTIIRVIDGDTYEIQYQNVTANVRLNGIQCPETKLYRGVSPAEKALGIRVKAYAEQTFMGKKATLIIGHKLFDKFKRLSGYLRVVVNRKEVDITRHLLDRGYGLPYDGRGSKPSFDGVHMHFDGDA